MTLEETVDLVEEEEIDTVTEAPPPPEEEDEEEDTAQVEEKHVPLSALTKMRKRAQEAEQEAQWLRQQTAYQQRTQPPATEEDDPAKYESATRAEVKSEVNLSRAETVRLIKEDLWIESNPEKYEMVNQLLPDFLKQRPNLSDAIKNSSNRYAEAYELMSALSPKQQKTLKAAPQATAKKKDAPGNPSGVPKSAALNESVDVMSMNDKEFNEWRNSKKKRR